MTKYQEEKRDLLKNVGYEEPAYKLKFNASAEELNRHLTESAIGVSNGLDVKNTVLLDNRFNLKNGSVEIKRSDEAQITILPNVIDKCLLRFKTSEYSPSINFEADFLSVAQVLEVKSKLMFRTPLFSLELGDFDAKGFSNANLHLTIEKQAELDEVIKMFKLFHPNNVNRDIICEVELNKEKRVIKFQCKLNYNLPDTTDVVDAINVLKSSYEIDGKSLTSVDELYTQRFEFKALACLIQNQVDEFTLNPKEGEDVTDNIKTPLSLAISLGTTAIGAICLLHAKDNSDNTYQVYRADVLQSLVFNDGIPELELIKKLEKEALSNLDLKNE